ncbi:MAG: metallophosphoesterase, partial [Tepidimonas taiwanensis]|nr:metallophosphoesterase [Tepidimonas taiwanensis]
MNAPAVLVQLSDCHIVRRGQRLDDRIDTPGLLAQAVRAVLALPARPDAVLGSGDLGEAGDAREYDQLRERLAPRPGAVWLGPGNHDAGAALRAAWRVQAAVHDRGAALGPG